MTATAWVDVMPTGLSSTTQPWTSRFFIFLAACREDSAAPGRPRFGAPNRIVDNVLVAVDIIRPFSPSRSRLHRRRSQKLLDPFRFVESLVDAEANFGRKFQVNAPRDLAAHIALVALERGDHFFDVAAAERHHIDRREPQIGAHAHLRHGDHVAFDHRIVDVAARKHVGELVTDQFADAQLPLRAALHDRDEVTWHDETYFLSCPGRDPRISIKFGSGVRFRDLSGLPASPAMTR
jgi:hypothetical protein